MREIKFRGKRVDNNEWIYGYYIEVIIRGVLRYFIIPHNIPCEKYTVFADLQKEVNPETVGQFTGLHDKNGKEIYEGDVLYEKYEDKAEESGYGEISNLVAFKNGCFGWIGEITGDFFAFDEYLIDNEVIGNIHDNPELVNQ